MTEDRSTAVIRGQLGTWRSGAESPSFPGASDARKLVEIVRPAVGDGCTLVRVRLEDRDPATLYDVRERLLRQESIVGTSIGREVGPDAPGTFDILVVPGQDPVTVGRTIAAVDEVVGVAAAAFETESRDATDSGTRGGSPAANRQPAGGGDEGTPDRSNGDAGRDLQETAANGTRDAAGNGRGSSGESAVLADEPGVRGLAALEEGDDHVDGQYSAPGASGPLAGDADSRSRANGGSRPGGSGVDSVLANGGRAASAEKDDSDDRIVALEARVAELESRLEAATGEHSVPDGELGERVAALESAIEDLQRWRRRTKAALLEDS